MALPVTIPNTFATATSAIPLSQLDANFNTLANVINDINSGAQVLANLKASNVEITGGIISNVTLDNVTVDVETLSNVTINGGNVTVTNMVATTANATTGNITTVNATTVDTTNIEVTNIKAKDGTAAVVLTDSTGAVAVSTPLSYTGTLTGGTGVINIGSGQVYKDASGNVGIGTTSPSEKLHVAGGLLSTSGNNSADVVDGAIVDYFDGDMRLVASRSGATNANMTFFTTSSGTFAERARITSGGEFLVGKTSISNALTTAGLIVNPSGSIELTTVGGSVCGIFANDTNGDILRFYRSSSLVGSISVTTTATAYNTSSDYRLKHDIQPMTGALAKVQQLKPCTYKWNADDSAGEGFIAHELQEVCPSAVTGEKDAVDAEGKPVYQGVDTSFLVATLTSAIQELKAELDTVKAELQTLKGN